MCECLLSVHITSQVFKQKASNKQKDRNVMDTKNYNCFCVDATQWHTKIKLVLSDYGMMEYTNQTASKQCITHRHHSSERHHSSHVPWLPTASQSTHNAPHWSYTADNIQHNIFCSLLSLFCPIFSLAQSQHWKAVNAPLQKDKKLATFRVYDNIPEKVPYWKYPNSPITQYRKCW